MNFLALLLRVLDFFLLFPLRSASRLTGSAGAPQLDSGFQETLFGSCSQFHEASVSSCVFSLFVSRSHT